MVKQKKEDGIKVKGMYRLQLTEDGKVVGDSGWTENQVVNLGFNQYLVSTLGAIAGSKQISHMALGSGTAPGAAATTLAGEVVKRASVTAATSSASKTVRFTATFSSSDSFVTNTQNLSNVGLFNTSSGGTIFAGNTYASSACATNQNVILHLRHLLGIIESKLRKFGGTLNKIETIPSQVLAFTVGKGVETRDGATRTVEGIVRTAWRHVELGRNDLAKVEFLAL